MNFDIDPDTTAIAEAVLRFIEREVLPLEARHQAVLGSERTLFQADGRYVPEALALRRQVRMRSAELTACRRCCATWTPASSSATATASPAATRRCALRLASPTPAPTCSR
ncbi:MAG: hypothetical protein MUF16_29650 [Burkholderiaceae bacterium]|nr:hypothetical protein [Burkholderiaceae bacterium]